jgi:hypothetical protein
LFAKTKEQYGLLYSERDAKAGAKALKFAARPPPVTHRSKAVLDY